MDEDTFVCKLHKNENIKHDNGVSCCYCFHLTLCVCVCVCVCVCKSPCECVCLKDISGSPSEISQRHLQPPPPPPPPPPLPTLRIVGDRGVGGGGVEACLVKHDDVFIHCHTTTLFSHTVNTNTIQLYCKYTQVIQQQSYT